MLCAKPALPGLFVVPNKCAAASNPGRKPTLVCRASQQPLHKVRESVQDLARKVSNVALVGVLTFGAVAPLAEAGVTLPNQAQQMEVPLAFLGFGEKKTIELPDGTKIPLDKLPPGIDKEAAQRAAEFIKNNPEQVKELNQATTKMMEKLSDPKIQSKFAELAKDPELRPFIEDATKNGPSAIAKYYNDPNFLQKLSRKMSDAGLTPESLGVPSPGPSKQVEIKTIHDAAKAGDVEALKSFLSKKGADVNGRDSKGVTPLGLAVGYDRLDAVKELLKSGADPNATDKQGNTPLHYAAGYGRKEAAKVLLKAGAKVDVKNKDKQPLQMLLLPMERQNWWTC